MTEQCLSFPQRKLASKGITVDLDTLRREWEARGSFVGSRNGAGRSKSSACSTAAGSAAGSSVDDDGSDIDVVGDDDSMDYESSSTAAPEDGVLDEAVAASGGLGPINYVKREVAAASPSETASTPSWDEAALARPFSSVAAKPSPLPLPMPLLLNNNNNEETNNKNSLRSSPVKLSSFSIESLLSRGRQAVEAVES